MASVLAVVAGSPAQAANTSSEALIDTNDDGVGDAREFGGRDRYDTSLRLAKNFAKGRGGLGGVPTAFVASGSNLVDAASVAGLAGFLDAPVLLTPTDNLHGRVADFIEDYGVDNIIVLGGIGAVADSVLEDMVALAGEPNVRRIHGADRYATAAAVAAELGGSASWCGGDEVAAILVSGAPEDLINAVMVGPIAHRLQLPLLLTAADELPAATADFIEAENVEQIVIIGGTDSVSEAVEAALSDAGVDSVERIAGDTTAATSAELAELMTDDSEDGCMADLAPVSTSTVALLHRDALPDGVAAAPVLSTTYANNGDLVPILIVGDTLPASVRDFLSSTNEEDAKGNKIALSVVAIGGTGAVSASVMEAATEAATSADQLTVKISGSSSDSDVPLNAHDAAAAAGEDPGRTFWLHFSDDVIQKTPDLETKIRDILEINGVPARLGQLNVNVPTYDEPPRKPIELASGGGQGVEAGCASDVVQVTVADGAALKAGDMVAVIESDIQLGDRDDQRLIAPTKETVPTTGPDRTRPAVSVEALVGQVGFKVTVTDAANSAPIRPTADDEGDRAFNSSDITFAAGSNSNSKLRDDADLKDPSHADEVVFEVPEENLPSAPSGMVQRMFVVFLGVGDHDGDDTLASPDVQLTLQRGDRITVKNSVFEDSAETPNRSRSVTVTATVPPMNPRVTSVRMSPQNHYTAQAGVRVPTGIAGGASTIWITANADSAAAGAAGNDWTVVYDRASTWSKNGDLDIDVRANTRDKVISIRFDDGVPDYDELVAAINSSSRVSALFTASNDSRGDPTAAEPCGRQLNNKLVLSTLQNWTRQIETSPDYDATNDDTLIRRVGDTREVQEVGFFERTGRTSVSVMANFNGYVDAIHDEALFLDVFAETLRRNKNAFVNAEGNFVDDAQANFVTAVEQDAEDGEVVKRTGLTFSGDGADAADEELTLVSDLGVDDNPLTALSTPTMAGRFDLVVSNVVYLPLDRDVVSIAGGKDRIFGDDPDTDKTEVATTAEGIDVATGFVDDPDTPTPPTPGDDPYDSDVHSPIARNEMLNASGQFRIQESRAITAPGAEG